MLEISPQLGAIGCSGCLAAAMDRSANALRLAGELDLNCATAVGDTLHAQFHGPRPLDLADQRFIDVTGLRALRGRTGQQVTVIGASSTTRRLMQLLAWVPTPTSSWSRPHERHAPRGVTPTAIPERPASEPARRRRRRRG